MTAVMLNPFAVILSPSPVILSEAKNLRSWLRIIDDSKFAGGGDIVFPCRRLVGCSAARAKTGAHTYKTMHAPPANGRITRIRTEGGIISPIMLHIIRCLRLTFSKLTASSVQVAFMFAHAKASYLHALIVTGIIATMSLTPASAGPASPPQKTSPAQKAQIAEDYGKLPLSFEANTGQAGKSVKFLSRGSGYGLYLTGNEAVLELQDSGFRIQDSGSRAKPFGAVSGWQRTTDHGLRITDSFLRMKLVNASLQDSGFRIQDSGPRAKPFGAMSGLQGTKDKGQRRTTSVLRLKVVNANQDAAVTGADELPGKVNYFLGNDPAKWHTSVPTYAKVRYAGIYPGIDLVYYGRQRQLEYDFVVAPGADPGVIALDVAAGLSRHPSSKSGGVPIRSGQVPPPLQIAGDGDLVIKTEGGEIRFHKPVVYQRQDSGLRIRDSGAKNPQQSAAGNRKSPITNRKSVEGRFLLDAQNRVRIALGPYDRTKPLVIDPVLSYSTFLGGSGEDNATAITVDTAGNAYVTGLTSSTDFPVTQGAFQTTNKDSENSSTTTSFVTKLNPAGTAVVYSTYLGGSGGGNIGDLGSAIAVDTAGNAYVAGQTYSTDFPVTQGAFQTTNKAAAIGGINAFVAKLNATGTALLYSTYLGGSGAQNQPGDSASGLAVDTSGNAYVTGSAGSTDFPVTAGAFQTTNHAAANERNAAFVTKLNATGTALVYSTYLGGSGTELGGDNGNAIAVDSAGNAYVAGQTYSTDFPVTPGAFQTTNHEAANVSTNAFVTKLNPTGTALVYSTYLGGSGVKVEYPGDVGNAIAVDAAGEAYVAGEAYSVDFPVTQGAFQTTNHTTVRSSNAFVTKLDPAGAALVYSTYLGGSGGVLNIEPVGSGAAGELASGLAIDSSGNVYVTGGTASTDFPVTPGAYQTTNHDQTGCVGGCLGGYNAFITELNSTGSALVYSTYLGGDGVTPRNFSPFLGLGDQARALAVDNSGNVYVTGGAQSFDFPVTAGAFQTTLTSWFVNPFVTKLNMSATSTAITPTVTVTPASSTITSAKAATVTVSVSGGGGNPTPTGTVTLATSSYSSAATALSGGSATIDISGGNCRQTLDEEWIINNPTAYCQDLLEATYIPDTASSSTYNFSSGLGLVNVVLPNISVTPSSTTLTWAQSQSQALLVTIAVTAGTGNPLPTGTVTLTTGSWSSAATALSGVSATISIPPGTLTKGTNTLNVSYSGDSNYAAEAAGGYGYVTVGGVTVSVVPSSSSITTTQALPVTITVSAGSGNPVPTGTVTLASGSYASAATALVGGSATITIPAGTLALGGDLLEASYSGDANYGAAGGGALVQVTPSPSFTITGTAVTVAPGATTGNTSTVTVTPAGGFTGSVALTAAVTSSPIGAQDPPTLSFGSTSPVSITGAAAGTATLTISTTAASSGCGSAYLMPRRVPWYPAGGAALVCLLLFGIPGRRRRWRATLAMVALLAALACGMLACGGGTSTCNTFNPGTTAGTYTITVTGTSGSTTATGTVTLTVQ